MKLTVLSPEKSIVSCEVTAVEIPGAKGRFMVLKGHAPLLSSIVAGNVRYDCVEDSQRVELAVKGGFVEVKNDEITICVD